MKNTILERCPSTLAVGYVTYAPRARKRLFDGQAVSHLLPYNSPFSESLEEGAIKNLHSLSISGVQEKFSVLIDHKKIHITEQGERATHILKPIPSLGKKREEIPANEHLTMQLAEQVFGINTAANGMVFFQDGSPAYVTRRFDRPADGNQLAVEDFASLRGITPQTHGSDYKYQGSYIDLFQTLKQFVPAYQVEAVKLYRLLVFNYLFSNGDAHWKNFSLIETPLGDYQLAPAYDLLSTRIHITDRDFALAQGLFPQAMGQGNIRYQFERLAELAEIREVVSAKILREMTDKSPQVEKLIEASFLTESTKRQYLQHYQTKLKKFLEESTYR